MASLRDFWAFFFWMVSSFLLRIGVSTCANSELSDLFLIFFLDFFLISASEAIL
jgi:hypothetical protein